MPLFLSGNGHLTDPFPYLRRVRQGCPLSPLLYVLAVEPLVERIRQEKDIRGLALPVTGEILKVWQFADDLSVIFTEGSSVDKLLDVLDTFSHASGSNVNKNKSKALNLGYWRGRPPDHICGIPIVESLKVVGIYIHPVKGIFYEWERILSSAEKTLNMWRSRSLSFFEKTILINSIVCAKLYYVSFSTMVPQCVIDKLNKLIFSFLLGNKHKSISRKTMVFPKQFGGCRAVDLNRKMAALHLTHIQRLLNMEHARWKALAVYWAGFCLRGLEPIFGSNLIPHSESRPDFYSILLDRFNAVHSSLPDMAWENATAKSLYNILGSFEPVVLKTVERNPTIDFRITWGALNSGLLAPYAHEMCFLIAHGTLPTNDLLHKNNISKRTSCFFCNQSESIAHLFFDCAVVQSTIDLLIHIFDHDFDLKNMLYYVNLPTDKKKLAVLLISEFKRTVWLLRNEAKFNRHMVSSSLIEKSFIMNIHKRIALDYERLTLQSFLKIWKNDRVIRATDDETCIVLQPDVIRLVKLSVGIFSNSIHSRVAFLSGFLINLLCLRVRTYP